MTTRMAQLIIRRPKAILSCIFLLTTFFAFHAWQIEFDSSLESLLPREDPEQTYYAEVRELFGSEEASMIGIVADDVYTPAVLEKIQRITEELKKIPEVSTALSLTNAFDIIKSVETDTLLIPDIPTTPAQVEAIKKRLAAQPIYLNVLVSADAKAAAITIALRDHLTTKEYIRRGIDEKIQAIVDQEQGPEQLYYTGLPHFKAYSEKAMAQDLSVLVPFVLLLMSGILYVSFRSLRGVVLPALTVLVSLIWTLGIMVLAGSSLSLGTITMPLLVLALGVAYSLHVVAEYYELARPSGQVDTVLVETVQTISSPVFLTGLTTGLGFLSLLLNPIISIREMGVYAAVGILLACVFSVVLVPACLALLRLPSRQEEHYAPVLHAALHRLIPWVIRHRGVIIIASAVIGIVSVWPISSLQVGSNFLSNFRPDHPVRQAADIMSRHLAGSLGFYVVIDGDKEGLMRQVETLRRLRDLQAYIDTLPGVDKTISLIDACELMEKGIHALPPLEEQAQLNQSQQPETPPTFWNDPRQRDTVFRSLAMMVEDKLSGLVDYPKYSRANILVRTSLSSPSEIAAVIEQIEAFADEHFPSELHVHPTGDLILLTRTAQDLISGQIRSLSLTACVIFVILSVMFLSVRIGIVAMVPNLFPIIVFFGLMGLSGAVLSTTTSIIAAIVLGLAVDDTIHLMTRLSRQVRTSTNEAHVLLQTFSTVGKPVFYTSVITFLGFLSLCLSTFLPVQEFGWLSAVTILVVFAGDLVLLPALLASTRVITLWDVLYLKLGRDPQRTIPLFSGLRPIQAKIVTLMGELQTFPAGTAIIRRGDMGNEMYVMIKGTADVFIYTNVANDQPRQVRTLARGDVFGEMGLLRHHERTADVIASEEVEVLAVNERFLTRIKRRYPRIAAEIFFNISKIVSDRLETSEQMQR